MACTITLDSITALAPDANNTPSALLISGEVAGDCLQLFVQLGNAVGSVVTVSDNTFTAELLLGEHYQSGEVVCGADNDVVLNIQCLASGTCAISQPLGFIACPDCMLAFADLNPVEAVAGTLTPTPTQVTIRGAVSGCNSVEVRFIYSQSDGGTTFWKDAVINNGQWQAVFTYTPASGAEDYGKDLSCDQSIMVEARCTDSDCEVSDTFTVNCRGDVDCPAPGLSAVVEKECLNNRRLVTFTVTLSGVTADTDVAGHIDTDDPTTGSDILIPFYYNTGSNSAGWTVAAGQATQTFSHSYPEGTYAPSVVLTGDCAAQAALGTVVDAEGNSLPDLTVPRCDCIDATVAIDVCRVTDPALTCADDIPDSACEPLTAAELSQPLPAGVYRATAVVMPNDAGPISWSENGTAISDAGGSSYCFTLDHEESLELIATVNLGLHCPSPGDSVTLTGEPAPDDGDDDCPDASVLITVCRVTNPNLTCADEISADDCDPMPEDDLAGTVPAGVYVVTAVTDPPGAGPITWSGDPLDGASGSRQCLTLAEGQTIELSATADLGPRCDPATDSVKLVGQPRTPIPPPDGCLINWCRLWLLINLGLSFLAGAMIVITACLLFTTTGVTWPFWVGVVISVVLVVVSILSFILWAAICGRLRRLCGPMVWVHDLLLLLSAASGVIGVILAFFGSPPCAIGFILDFAYYGVLAAILQAVIRLLGCPLGQNGIIGVIVSIFNWLTDTLGLNGNS